MSDNTITAIVWDDNKEILIKNITKTHSESNMINSIAQHFFNKEIQNIIQIDF